MAKSEGDVVATRREGKSRTTWPAGNAAIVVRGLSKRYGTLLAVDDVTFSVARGEIFGLIGPNGAGKTTTLECLIGLREPTAGQIQVGGLDPRTDRRELTHRIGVQLQESALPDRLRISEAIRLFGSFYEHHADPEDLMSKLGLQDIRNKPYAALSGGQKQRVHVALALVGQPEILFLDEVTSGLDVHARNAVLDFLRETNEREATILMTTHYLQEAERLCDRVAIIYGGRIVAMDTVDGLIASTGAKWRVTFRTPQQVDVSRLRSRPAVVRVTQRGETIAVYGADETLLSVVSEAAAELGWSMGNARTEPVTLEDVFLMRVPDVAPDQPS